MRSGTSVAIGVFALSFLAVVAAVDRAAASSLYCDPEPSGLFIEMTPGANSGGGTVCPVQPGTYCQNPPGVMMIAGPTREIDFDGTSYTVRYRFPLTLVGNSQNTDTDFTAQVFWFNQSSPPAGGCLPGFNACNPTTSCGYLGAKFLFDSGDTYIQASGITCGNIPATLGTYSFSVYRCNSPFFSCQRGENSGTADFTPQALRAALNCPVPPTDGCPDDAGGQICCIGPGGASPGGGTGGASGGGQGWGPGKTLRYRAAGVGHPGFPGSTVWNQSLGRYWSHDFVERIVMDPNDQHVWLLTRFGTFREWSKGAAGAGDYSTVRPSDEKRTLTRTGAGWQLRGLDGSVQTFNAAGLWVQTADRDGNLTTGTLDAASRISGVTYPDGLSETYSYSAGTGKLAKIVENGVAGAAAREWDYTWTGDDLSRIDRPDGTAFAFVYGDAAHPGYMTRMDLVAIGGAHRVEAGWEYDAQGNVVRTWKGDNSATGANAVERYSFGFDNPALPALTTMTDQFGKVTTFSVDRDPGGRKPRLTAISGDCPVCASGPNATYSYADAANPLEPTLKVDGDGTRTAYTYDAHGQILSRTEAMGTAVERTTTWQYSATFPALVTRVEVPSTSSGTAATAIALDGAGNAISRTISGVEAGSSFSNTATSTFNAAGQPLTLDPPGNGSADQTVLTYDPARGDLMLATRQEPLTGTTTFAYDAFNRRASTTDPNGVATLVTYDALDRVTGMTTQGDPTASPAPVPDLVTIHTYDAFGDLLRTTFPRGNVVEYGYDLAGRLISVERKPDAATPGERVLYTLDVFGNRTEEDLQRWTGSAWVTDSTSQYVYSSRCHLDKEIHPDGSVTEYSYNCDGMLDRVWDANHPSGGGLNASTRTYGYDPLDRVISQSEPWNGAGGGTATIGYGYDPQDHLARVTDANGGVTTSVYGDRGLMTSQASEAAGTTTWTYDVPGQMASRTDPRGVTVTWTRDVLGRPLLADFPDNSLDTTYTYDAPGPYAAGLLTSVTRNGQTIAYAYDRFGRTVQDGALTYAWDGNGNRTGVGYPNGVKATYGFDFADREASLTMQDGGGAAQSLASGVTYKAAGPLSALTLGNGLAETHGYDARYFPTGVTVPGRLDWTYSTDHVGNVTTIADNLTASASRSFSYQDVQYDLTQANGPWGSLAWSYDKLGDRLSEVRAGAAAAYAYAPNGAGNASARLASVTGGAGAASYFYDSAGDLSFRERGGAKLRFGWDAEGHLSQIRNDAESTASAGLSRINYDGRGLLASSTFTPFLAAALPERETTATAGSDGTLYLRSALLRPGPGSPRNQATVKRDAYVFHLAGRPVAVYEKVTTTPVGGGGTVAVSLRYLTTDPLGVPVLATDAGGAALWSGGFEPFGADWNGAQQAGVFLRYPGEWEDETWQNPDLDSGLDAGRRWLDVETGRYTQADAAIYYLAGPLVSRLLAPSPAGLPRDPLSAAASLLRPFVAPEAGAVNSSTSAVTVCNNCGKFRWEWKVDKDHRPPCGADCFEKHEEDHIKWFEAHRPKACEGKKDGDNPNLMPGDKAATECSAYKVSKPCLEHARLLNSASRGSSMCTTYLDANIKTQEREIAKYCPGGTP
jgi:YD repeat-containing protein